ncbi:hypothetical protein BX600DRAFT_475743 [Xylariales sp. PMI_506]|nr:hypothetical protein BX600DRAFT_475743 [Xylariales sp. PMI_506]
MESAPHAAQAAPPAYAQDETAAAKPGNQRPVSLRRYKRTALLFGAYLVLLIFPWVMICVLDVRPLSRHGTSYFDAAGRVTDGEARTVDRLYTAMRALWIVTAFVSVPATSALLNQVAVGLAQRRHANQKLSAAQLFDLADAPWSRLLWVTDAGDLKSRLGYRAAWALVMLAALQLILQSVLVFPEQISVVTNVDVPGVDVDDYLLTRRYLIGGYDAGPGSLARTAPDPIVQELSSRMNAMDPYAPSPNLWPEPFDHSRMDTSVSGSVLHDYLSEGFSIFASSIPAGFNTGVLRYHATRLNSTGSCVVISSSEYPESCSGTNSFAGDVTIPDQLQFRWCIPGWGSDIRWSSTRDRQDITEDLYWDVSLPTGTAPGETGLGSSGFTLHCSASSTMGTFELPSFKNQGVIGSLLEEWPSEEELEEFNDLDNGNEALGETDDSGGSTTLSYYVDPGYESTPFTPGPLMTAMRALLGNSSWLAPVVNGSLSDASPELAATIYLDICNNGVPLVWLNDVYSSLKTGADLCTDAQSWVAEGYAVTNTAGIIFQWLSAWYPVETTLDIGGYTYEAKNTTALIRAVTHLANEALMSVGSTMTASSGARTIYTSSGITIVKPSVSLAAKIVISVVLLLQVAGLIALFVFILRVPVFARRFDALTMAAIGAQFAWCEVPLPPLGRPRAKSHLKNLHEFDGVIGFEGTSAATTTTTPTSSSTLDGHSESEVNAERRSEAAQGDNYRPPSDVADWDIELGNLTPQNGNASGATVASGSRTLLIGGQGIVRKLPRSEART